MTHESKTALVTGSSKGIGRAITEALLAAEFQVVGLARTHPKALAMRDDVEAMKVDFSDLGGLPQKLKEIAKAAPTIDVLILNAGMGRFGELEQFSAAQIRDLVDLNLTSQILVARQWIAAMKTRRRGRIVIIGSTAALKGGQKGAVYSATKFGLRGFAQSLREECAGAGISVSIVNPGMVDTEFYQTQQFRPSQSADCHLTAADVADAVMQIINARAGAVTDEITLRPQKHVIDFLKP